MLDKLINNVILGVVRLTCFLAVTRTAKPVWLPLTPFYWTTGRLTTISLPNHKEAYYAYETRTL